MKTVIIKYFNFREQNRISFIRLLTDYNSKIGLRRAKDKFDSMILNKKPVDYELDESWLDAFTQELIKLKLEFKIK
jgi:hypothetical protein